MKCVTLCVVLYPLLLHTSSWHMSLIGRGLKYLHSLSQSALKASMAALYCCWASVMLGPPAEPLHTSQTHLESVQTPLSVVNIVQRSSVCSFWIAGLYRSCWLQGGVDHLFYPDTDVHYSTSHSDALKYTDLAGFPSLPLSLSPLTPPPQPPRSPGHVGCSSSHAVSAADASHPSSHLCPNGTLSCPLVPSDYRYSPYLQCPYFSKYVTFLWLVCDSLSL